ncbi:zinc-binding dehydrogenase [Lederbergia citri]|uniref:Zinc-binding dehydrogenase n=1 Tax=Lederbergia citri TaxID=2833580 RepID=A0A942TFR4_9BACI|nr:zinc-binding dehydrogenase [Lederbergia citri]MBS4195702.1 zinc-binding dehydrogenase [Lederbergia citri]
MLKQLLAVAPHKAQLDYYEDREINEDEVKVKVEFAAPKHGSELAGFRGESPHINDYYDEDWHTFLPRDEKESKGVEFGKWNLGNQWVGRIIQVGSKVTDYKLGDRVCSYGGIRETHIVNAINNFYLLKMPEEMSWKNALCFDPAQFALGGIRDSQLKLGDRVAVIGLGAIGQLAVQLAKLAGASFVAAIDPIEKRRKTAVHSGADIALDPIQQDIGLELKKLTNKLGVDVIIETSANERALQQALRGLAYGGTIAYVGWARPFKGGLDFGREAHFNNAKLVFSRACSEPNPDYPRWSWRRIEEVCWKILSEGLVSCEDIIDPVVPFVDSAFAYEEYVDRNPRKSVKLGIDLTDQ